MQHEYSLFFKRAASEDKSVTKGSKRPAKVTKIVKIARITNSQFLLGARTGGTRYQKCEVQIPMSSAPSPPPCPPPHTHTLLCHSHFESVGEIQFKRHYCIDPGKIILPQEVFLFV